MDRTEDDFAVSGDSGRLEAQFRVAGDAYTVELESVGGNRARAFARHPIGGGVIFDREIYGYSGIGSPRTTQGHAAFALWGVGRVLKNGRLCSETALVHAAALSRGAHADDGTHRLLPEARDGDAEIHVLVEHLPAGCVPAGFIEFWFDDVQVEVDGTGIPSLPFVDTVPARNPDEVRASLAAQMPIGYYGPQAPGLYAFDGAQVARPAPSPGTALGSRIPPEPLIPTEPPLNTQPLQPQTFPELSRPISTPQPLNALPATPLIRNETPLNSLPPPNFAVPPPNPASSSNP
jgi:hypothetical protein